MMLNVVPFPSGAEAVDDVLAKAYKEGMIEVLVVGLRPDGSFYYDYSGPDGRGAYWLASETAHRLMSIRVDSDS